MANEHTITHFLPLPQHSYNSPNLPVLLPKSSQGCLGPTVLLSLLFPVKYRLMSHTLCQFYSKNTALMMAPVFWVIISRQQYHNCWEADECEKADLTKGEKEYLPEWYYVYWWCLWGWSPLWHPAGQWPILVYHVGIQASALLLSGLCRRPNWRLAELHKFSPSFFCRCKQKLKFVSLGIVTELYRRPRLAADGLSNWLHVARK